MKSFRFTKLLNAMVNRGDAQAQRDADAELSVVERGSGHGGFVIPPEAVASMEHQRIGVRVLSTASGSGAGVVPTDVRGDMFIDSLLAQNYGLQRAKIYTGLVGNVEIPTESNTITAGWVAETVAGNEVNPTIGQITLKPKRLSTHVDVSRALLTMGNPDVEDLVKYLLSRAISNALDNAIFYGTGTAPQPAGIANLTGVNTKIDVTPANAARGDKIWEACVKAEQNLADATEVVAVVANGLITCPRLLMIRLCLASIHLVGDFGRLAVPLFFAPGNPLAKCFDLCRDRGERVILSRSVIFPVGRQTIALRLPQDGFIFINQG